MKKIILNYEYLFIKNQFVNALFYTSCNKAVVLSNVTLKYYIIISFIILLYPLRSALNLFTALFWF